jgi:hypothetical protein
MMKEGQPKQADKVSFAGKSSRIIISISAKGLLQCSLDSFTKGKRGVCVSRYKDCKIDDARKFIAALAFVDIPKSPIRDVSSIVLLGQIMTGFNALLLRPFFVEASQRDYPTIVSIFDRDVECIATTYRCERYSPPLLQGPLATASDCIWCNCLLKLLNRLRRLLRSQYRKFSQTRG